MPGDRGEVDDGAAMLARLCRFAQCRSGQFGAEEHAGHVHGDQPVPLVQAYFFDPLAHEDARVVDKDVELAEPTGGKLDGGGPVLLLCYV
jgi:hypothetical protein